MPDSIDSLDTYLSAVSDIIEELRCLSEKDLSATSPRLVHRKLDTAKAKLEVAAGILDTMVVAQGSDTESYLSMRRIQYASLTKELADLVIQLRRRFERATLEKRRQEMELNGKVRLRMDVITSLENVYRLLSQESVRSEESLLALKASTDVLRIVSSEHSAISAHVAVGRAETKLIKWIENRDRLIIGTLFVIYCILALFIVRKRLRRIHVYPWFLP